jgi:hypothetical protein
MEDVRTYRDDRKFNNDENEWAIPDDEREYETAPRDEVPFHIPRD